MKAEIFLKNGRKTVIGDVTSINKIKQSDGQEIISIEYERKFEGEFTICDMPSVGFIASSVDMIKLIDID